MNQDSNFGGFIDGTATTGIENIRGKAGLGGNKMFWVWKILSEVPTGHRSRERHRNLSFSGTLKREHFGLYTLNWKHNNVKKGPQNLID